MWAAFSENFAHFAENLAVESTGFIETFNQIASELAYSGVYAGDEHTPEALDLPLDTDALLALQRDARTYTQPLSSEETAVFAQWARVSPLSSLHARERLRRAGAADGPAASGSPAEKGAADGGDEGTPARRLYADEPEDVVRQRLLDYSEAVHEQYTALVGDAVSPRSHGSPASPAATPQQQQQEGEREEEKGGARTPAGESPFPAALGGGGLTTPEGRRPAVSENDFFDRYFFRLAQLRVRERERRRLQEEEEEGEGEGEEEVARQREEGAAAPEGQQKAAAKAGQQAQGAADAAPFAERLMQAASELVRSVDEAMMGNGRAPDSDGDEADAGAGRGGFSQTAELEKVVQELQEELRRERRRVRQLEDALRARGITPPPSPAPTPAKPPLTVVATAAAAASSPTAAATTPATGGAANDPSSPPLAAAAGTPEASPEAEASPSPASASAPPADQPPTSSQTASGSASPAP